MFKRLKIRFKKDFEIRMIAINFIFILAIIIFFTGIRYKTSVTEEKKNVENLIEQISESSAAQFNSLLDDMSRISLNLATSNVTQSILKQAIDYDGDSNYFDVHINERRELIQSMQQITGTVMNDISVNIVSSKGDYLLLDLYNSVMLNRQEMREISKMDQLNETQQYKFITGFEVDRYGRTEEPFFSFIRKISDEFNNYGYIEIQKSMKSLDEIFSISENNFGIISILTLNDALFYASEDSDLTSFTNDLKNQSLPQEVTDCKLNGDTYLVYSVPISEYGFVIYTTLPESYYNKQISHEILILLIQSVFLLFATLLLIMLVSMQVYRPVKELREKMEHANLDNLELDLTLSDDADEIETFNYVFAQMVTRIQSQNEKLVEQKMHELEVSYNALQAQVSPHFLHNTLYLIGLKGAENGVPEILDMCSALTRMMAYCVDNQNDLVLFSKEIEYTNYYLQLMKYRYLETLDYSMDIEDEINQLVVPKFILQPLVENCFQHGFKDSPTGNYQIHVSIRIQDKEWILCIEDNGKGFSRESIQHIEEETRYIRDSLRNSNSSFISKITKVGLINTYTRLLIYSQGRVQLILNKSSLSGALVEIHCSIDPASSHATEGK